MQKISSKCKNDIMDVIAKELDTRDKRFMFLKIKHPESVYLISLEGSPNECSWLIFDNLRTLGKLKKLVDDLNLIFDTKIIYEEMPLL